MEIKLKKHKKYLPPEGPTLIVIMDGVGIGGESKSNAVKLSHTPNLDWLIKNHSFIPITAHGTSVGLPSDEDMGNSEVGHNAIGAGRIFDQGAKLVNSSIKSGELYNGDTWNWLIEDCKKLSSHSQSNTFHIIGLLSDGNVHSHIDQILSFIEHANLSEVKNLRVHTLLDGRDVQEKSALIYIEKLEIVLKSISSNVDRDYRIASGGGRMFLTMDRYEADTMMIKRGWECHVEGKGRRFSSARQAVETYRAENEKFTDQYLPEFVIVDKDEKPIGLIKSGDSVLYANFRGDRSIEMSKAFEEKEFWGMERASYPDVKFAGIMEYDGDLHIPKKYLVDPPLIEGTMGEILSTNNISQLAISETQKFGHVTYFWNGNKSGKFNEENEKYIEIKSDNTPFEDRPWMKAVEITETLINELEMGIHKQARVNFANGDMVGHTGKLYSTIMGVETVDLCLGRLLQTIIKLNGVAIITADHGNADEMFILKNGVIQKDKSGKPLVKTSHTLNPVPFIIFDPSNKKRYPLSLGKSFGLANIAGTILNVMGYQAPDNFSVSMLN